MFNERSQKRLKGVNPRLIEVLRAVRERTGINFEVSEGLRNAERQRQLVAQGKSQTMNSRHLTGNAVDIHLVNPDGTANWDFEAYRPVATAAKQIAGELGYDDLVWGGDWKTLKDGVHFQVGGKNPAQRQAPQVAPSSPPAREMAAPIPPVFAEHALPSNAITQPEQEAQNALYQPSYTGLDPNAFRNDLNPVQMMSFYDNPYLRALT